MNRFARMRSELFWAYGNFFRTQNSIAFFDPRLRFFITSQDCTFPGAIFASIKVLTILNARNLQVFGRRQRPPYLPSHCEIRPGEEMRRGLKVQVLHVSPRAMIKAIITATYHPSTT